MNIKKAITACLLALLILISNFSFALAHTTVHAGNYDIEVGWTGEPPVIGQQNAVVVNVSDSTSPDAMVDISQLVVNLSYGGQIKSLTLQPLSENTKNQYVAPIIPTIPGQYTVQLRGKIASTDVNLDVQPEEVQTADVLAFPNVNEPNPQQNKELGLSDWLAIFGLVFGLAGFGVALFALRKTTK